MTSRGIFVFLLYFMFGIYFVNFATGFYEFPEIISQFEELIFFVGGILIIFGGISSWRLRRRNLIPHVGFP